MNSKTFLVAQREYGENVRTKAFWIGILSVPVLITLGILVPNWLEKKKDARRYAVIDESGWLLTAVEEKASGPDLAKVLKLALTDRQKKRDLAKYPPRIRQWAEAVPANFIESDKMLEMVTQGIDDAFLKIESTSDEAEGQEESELAALAMVRKGLDELRPEVEAWWKRLPSDEARQLSSGLDRSRYEITRPDLPSEDPEAVLKEMLEKDQLFAYFVIGPDPVAGSEGCRYVSQNVTDNDLRNWFSNLATSVVRQRRIQNASLDPVVARKIQESLTFGEKKISATGEIEEVQGIDRGLQWAPVVFVYLLWISIFTVAQMLLTNTIEEKSNRIIEVLLSSVSPLQLMTGKIIGIAATGLTMVASWVGFFLLGMKVMPLLIGVTPPDFLAQVASDPFLLGSFLFYFVIGFILYSALLVGIGSVCNSLKEAQNLMQPVVILLIVPLLAMVPIGQDPNGTLARFLSYVPPFTPFVMMNRAAGPPTFFEYVATTIVLVTFTAICFWAAAKIFRIGILMTGKPPKISEILRWIKAPVGTVPEKD